MLTDGKRVYDKDKAVKVAEIISDLMEFHDEEFLFSEWSVGFASALTYRTIEKLDYDSSKQKENIRKEGDAKDV